MRNHTKRLSVRTYSITNKQQIDDQVELGLENSKKTAGLSRREAAILVVIQTTTIPSAVVRITQEQQGVFPRKIQAGKALVTCIFTTPLLFVPRYY